MQKERKFFEFQEARAITTENLDAIKINLSQCISDGMLDLEDELYNELLSLIDEADASETWDDLAEVIIKAKTLEIDVATWLSYQGKTSISLPWPQKPI